MSALEFAYELVRGMAKVSSTAFLNNKPLTVGPNGIMVAFKAPLKPVATTTYLGNALSFYKSKNIALEEGTVYNLIEAFDEELELEDGTVLKTFKVVYCGGVGAPNTARLTWEEA